MFQLFNYFFINQITNNTKHGFTIFIFNQKNRFYAENKNKNKIK